MRRYSWLGGLICAFVFGLLSITNANAGLITQDVDIVVNSYIDDSRECHHSCGDGFLQWTYDPSDLLNTFQYEIGLEGFLNGTWHNGPAWFDWCDTTPGCLRFGSLPDAEAWLKTQEFGAAFVGEFDISEVPFNLFATTIALTQSGLWFFDTISLDKFGHGEWSGEIDEQEYSLRFSVPGSSVPEPPVLPIFLLGLFVLITRGLFYRSST